VARRRCEQIGVSQAEMRGCIFDNGFLNINPNPIPTPTNPTQGATLPIVIKPYVNNNHTIFANGGLLGAGNGAHPITPNVGQSDINGDQVSPSTSEPKNKGTEIDSPKPSSPFKPNPTPSNEMSNPVIIDKPNRPININVQPKPNAPATNPVSPSRPSTPQVKGIKIGKG
jgi:hypothetical protein